MLQAFVITLREGLEAFLIIAISLAYLKKTGRRSLIPAVHWGIAGSVALSILAGVLFAARTLGYKVLLYDGSFEDWSARPGYPVETVARR